MCNDFSPNHWHPSGQTPVYDDDMNLAGYTVFKIPCRSVKLATPEGARYVEVMRLLREPGDGEPFWIYWVCDGDPAHVPGFCSYQLVSSSPSWMTDIKQLHGA